MNLFITTFESVIVLFGIGLIGFWIIRKKIVSEKALAVLIPLALDIALPSLIFVNIVQGFSPAETPDWWQLPVWWGIFTCIIAGLTFCFKYVSNKATRKEFAVTLFYQNGIFFPLAILTGMFPNESLYPISLFLFTLFYAAFFFSTNHLFFGKTITLKQNWKKIAHPVLIATLIALGIRFGGLHTVIPEFVLTIFSMIGAMTIPLIMFILGGNIYIDFHKKGKIQFPEIIKFVLIKNFIFPAIFLILIYTFKSYLSYPIALILVIQSAVPPITAIPIITERNNGDRSIVNQFIFASFIISLLSIPVMIWFFDKIY